jgi:hypothetical protein
MKFWWMRSILRDEQADGGNGGGAGGSAANQAPPPLTLEAIAALVSKGVNDGISAFEKRLEKKAKSQQTAASTQQQQTETTQSTPTETTQSTQKQGDQPKTQEQMREDLRFASLERKLQEQQDKNRESEQRALAAEAKRRESERLSQIRGELGKFQYAKSNGADMALRLIGDEIKWDDDSDALVTPTGEPIADYIRTKLEKDYDTLLAPLNIGGAGAKNPGKNGPGNAFDTKELGNPKTTPERMAEIRQHIANTARKAMLGDNS